MSFLFTVLAVTQTATAERPITLREAMSAAATANPSLRRSVASVESAEGSLMSAQGSFDPSYNLDGSWTSSRTQGFFQSFPFESTSRSWNLNQSMTGNLATGTNYSLSTGLNRNFTETVTDFGLGVANEAQIQDSYQSDVRLSLTQQLLEGVRYRYNLRNITIARQNLGVAELTNEQTRQDVLKQASDAYWNWAYQVKLRDIARNSVEVAQEALRVGELKVQVGELAPVEQTRLEAALVQAQANELDAETNLEQAANNLLLVMGEAPDQVILPATEPGEVPEVDLAVSDAIEVALSQNLDLAVARANLESADIELLNAKHARLPSLAATGSVGVQALDDSAGRAISGLTDEDATPFVSLSGSLTVPLGNRSNRGSVDSAAATRRQRQVDLEELERSVAAQVEQQVRTLESAQRRVELADVNLRLAEETLAAEEALAEAGRSIQKDVLEARTEVDRTRAEAAKARTDYRLAQVELLRLQGQLTEDVP